MQGFKRLLRNYFTSPLSILFYALDSLNPRPLKACDVADGTLSNFTW